MAPTPHFPIAINPATVSLLYGRIVFASPKDFWARNKFVKKPALVVGLDNVHDDVLIIMGDSNFIFARGIHLGPPSSFGLSVAPKSRLYALILCDGRVSIAW